MLRSHILILGTLSLLTPPAYAQTTPTADSSRANPTDSFGCDGCDGYYYDYYDTCSGSHDLDRTYYDNYSGGGDFYSNEYDATYARDYNAQNCSNAKPICGLYASEISLRHPADVIISWDSQNATSGTMNNGIGNLVGAAGHVPVHVGRTTTFNGTFYGSGIQVNCSVNVVVYRPARHHARRSR